MGWPRNHWIQGRGTELTLESGNGVPQTWAPGPSDNTKNVERIRIWDELGYAEETTEREKEKEKERGENKFPSTKDKPRRSLIGTKREGVENAD